MQITMNVDASQMSESVVEILKSLNEEQRKDIAKDILVKWLQEPNSFEHAAHSREVIIRLRNDYYYKNDFKDASDEDIKQHYKYKEEIKKYPTAKEVMVGEITNQIVSYYKEEVVNFIKNDETVNNILAVTLAQIKEDFPKYVHNAMVYYFTQNLNNLGNLAAGAMSQANVALNLSNQIQEKLRNQNSY